MEHTCHRLPITPSPSTTPQDQKKIITSDFCPGREREGWIVCPKLWTFRGTSWAIGFRLASLRAQIELYLDAWGPLRTNKSWVACSPEHAWCSKVQNSLWHLPQGREKSEAGINALAFPCAAWFASCLKLSTGGNRVPGWGPLRTKTSQRVPESTVRHTGSMQQSWWGLGKPLPQGD